MYWHQSWEEKAGAYWWRNHTCQYPFTTPYVDIKENLDENTMRHKVIKEDSPYFEVEYTSGGTVRRSLGALATILISPIGMVALSIASHKCAGEVQIWVRPLDIESNALMLQKKKDDLKRIKEQIEKEKEKLTNVISENSASLLKKMEFEIRRREERSLQLERIVQFVNDTIIRWTQPHKTVQFFKKKKMR